MDKKRRLHPTMRMVPPLRLRWRASVCMSLKASLAMSEPSNSAVSA